LKGGPEEAYALLDRRPLYRWILQPLDAFGRSTPLAARRTRVDRDIA
jgi:hypothetical protein